MVNVVKVKDAMLGFHPPDDAMLYYYCVYQKVLSSSAGSTIFAVLMHSIMLDGQLRRDLTADL